MNNFISRAEFLPSGEEERECKQKTAEQSQFDAKISSLLNGKTPDEIIKGVLDSYPEQKEHLESLHVYKAEYSEKGIVGKWWNKAEMQEKTNEAVFLLTKMSDSQLKLQVLLVWMTNELKKQQDVIVVQQIQLKLQSEALENNQNLLFNQQEQLEKQTHLLEIQGELLAKQSERLHKENEELIQRAAELRELREIGQEHDEAIDEHDHVLTGMERFLIELKQVIAEYREDQNTLKDHATRIDEHDHVLTGMERFLIELKQVVAEYREDQNTLKDHTKKMEELDGQVKIYSEDISSLEKRTIDLQNSIPDLLQNIDDIQKKFADVHIAQEVFLQKSENEIAKYINTISLLAEKNSTQKRNMTIISIWLAILSLALGGLFFLN